MKKILYILLAAAALYGTGCKKALIEENHAKLTDDNFNVENGLNAAYAGLRDIYGPEEGITAFTAVGTDEFRISNGNRTTNVASYNSSYNSSNEFSERIWNSSYQYINTCSAVVDFGTDMDNVDEVTKEKIAEARFLRAFYYFNLVQFFGDVTLNKNFSNSPTTSATRNSRKDVYDFIVEDLQAAITDLSPSPMAGGLAPGRASGAAAKHLLAKVYLTRAYSSDAVSSDFQQAYETAKGLIDTAPSLGLGLLDDFAAVNKPLNEASKEVLFSVQYSRDLTYGGGHALNHFYVNKYDTQLGERNLNDGRSYAWFRGTKWLYDFAFADKINDSRYYKTFQSVWIATKPLSGTYKIKVSGVEYTLPYSFKKGDTAMVMPGYNMPVEAIQKKKYYVYTPENYTDATIFPTMVKYLDPNRDTPNENSHRPVIVFRLAETYLLAAEAAFKLGQISQATNYLNVIRTRAAAPGKEAQMQIRDASVTLDFILDERSRELCGENLRWFDLVRTNKLLERVKKYDDFEAKNNIRDFHVLRPVPLSQINAVINGTPYPQNPGW